MPTSLLYTLKRKWMGAELLVHGMPANRRTPQNAIVKTLGLPNERGPLRV